ncbi:hypothetical protein DPMN_025260 [Dreissena polymorpha]|uniref:Uncharacterized protein n=1 Tax=Dreissena polymorpha TaxID=45954 RepID=A0A9D4LR13_DREPO|nr:hypothetical protein DPMN_025260 [Dreissena polymorpha]
MYYKFISPTVVLLFSGEHQHWYRVGQATAQVRPAGAPIQNHPFPPLIPSSSHWTSGHKGSASLHKSVLQ